MQKKPWSKELIIQGIRDLEIKLGRRPTKHDTSLLYSQSRKYFGTWNNAMEAAGYSVKLLQKPKIPKYLSQCLAYFAGLLITDGHILYNKRRKNYKISIYNSYEEEVAMILNLIKVIFDYKASVYKRKKWGFNKRVSHDIQINSKDLAEFLHNKLGLPYGAKSFNARVPLIFFDCLPEYSTSFLRGVLDGDGNICKVRASIFSASMLFIKDLQQLLLNFGVICKIRIHTKPTNTLLYILEIPKKDLKNLYSLLYEDVTFYFLRKQAVWQSIYKS